MKPRDISNQKFGRLVAVTLDSCRRVGKKGQSCRYWLCKCDCGNEKIARQSNLVNGLVQSCGCLQRQYAKFPPHMTGSVSKLLPGQAAFNALYANYEYAARKRGLEWLLTREECAALFKQDCFYCGMEPKQRRKPSSSPTSYTYNGIDRLNSGKGYTPDNCVPCCKQCNRGKMEYPLPEFIEWIKRVHRNLDSKQEVVQAILGSFR